MDSISGPSSPLQSLAQALLLRQGLPSGDVEALVKAVGQELAIRYLGQGTEGAQLELPGGQVVSAQGEVPFPEGTQLRVRVTNENGALKLQTLEARPPASPSLLAPLLQGEASSLVAQLQQPAPPSELVPLVQLFRVLLAGNESPRELPTEEALAREITLLPKSLAADLAKALEASPGESPVALAQRLLAAKSPSSAQAGERALAAPAGELLAHFQKRLGHAELVPEPRGALEAWLRGQLGQQSQPMSVELAPARQGLQTLPRGNLAGAGLPDAAMLATEIASLPKDLGAALAKVMGAEAGESPQVMAQRLLAAEEPGSTVSDQKVPLAAGEWMVRFQNLLTQAELPAEPQKALDAWIRGLLGMKTQETTINPGSVLAQGIRQPAGREVSAATSPGLPSVENLAREIALLPKELAASLARMLGAAVGESPTVLAQLLLASQEPGIPLPVEHTVPLTASELLIRIQFLLKQADLPPQPRAALDAWIRGILGKKPPERTAELSAAQGTRVLSQGDLAKVVTALKDSSVPPAQVPEVWEAWVKGSVRTLADPELSPREAPFHALQGKENTAFFEIPLPWAGSKPLQLWVEEDAPEPRGEDPEPVTRVLMGLAFTRLGETRVGLQRSGGALSARIWTEHPDLLESQQAQVEQELHEIAATVDLRILQLNPGPDGGIPELRALVLGSGSMHALG